jgi:hypothetical protein
MEKGKEKWSRPKFARVNDNEENVARNINEFSFQSFRTLISVNTKWRLNQN